MLAKDPRQRFPTGGALADVADAVLEGRYPDPAPPVPPLPATPASLSGPPATALPGSPTTAAPPGAPAAAAPSGPPPSGPPGSPPVGGQVARLTPPPPGPVTLGLPYLPRRAIGRSRWPVWLGLLLVAVLAAGAAAALLSSSSSSTPGNGTTGRSVSSPARPTASVAPPTPLVTLHPDELNGQRDEHGRLRIR